MANLSWGSASSNYWTASGSGTDGWLSGGASAKPASSSVLTVNTGGTTAYTITVTLDASGTLSTSGSTSSASLSVSDQYATIQSYSSYGLTLSTSLAISAGTLDFNTGAKLTLGSTAGTMAGLNVTSSSASATISSTGTVNVTNLAVSAGTFSQSGGTVAVTTLASFTGGTDTISSGTLTAGTLTVGALAGAAATLTLSGGTTTVSGVTTIESASTAGGSKLAMSGGSLATTGGLNFAGTSNYGTVSGFGTINGAITGAGAILASGGTLDLIGAGSSANSVSFTIASGADLKFDGAATTNAIAIASGETLEVGSVGALTIGAPETNSGGFVRLDGGSLTDTSGLTLSNGGTLVGSGTVNPTLTAGTGGGTVRASGGALDLVQNVGVSSGLIFTVGTTTASILEFAGSVGAGNTITFAGTASAGSAPAIEIVSPGSFNGTVSGLVAETAGATTVAGADYINITLATAITSVTVGDGTTGNRFTGTNASATTLNLYNGATKVGTINLASAPTSGTYVDWGSASGITSSGLTSGTDIFLDSSVCFAAGTRILTVCGEVAVEHLSEGDLVVTQGGEQHPIKWLGHRRVDLLRHPNPHAAAPVRIQRGAFGENLPHRDLVVSPEHCLFVDGGLVPAKRLINEMTIVQERDTRVVTYYHIELDRHGILFAEGLPAESYLDTGNRAFFANAGLAVVLHPEFTINAGLKCWETDACAPLMTGRDAVKPVWDRLAERAKSLGYQRPDHPLTDAPDLRIKADGRTIRPVWGRDNRYVFALPAGVSAARLVSRASIPSDLDPYVDDWRLLGVAVRRIVLRNGADMTDIALDDPGLAQGWHAMERNDTRNWRWTNGDAVLPIHTDKATLVEVHVAMAMRYAGDVEGIKQRLAA